MMAVSPVPFSQFGPSILAAHLIVVQRCCFWNDNDIRLLLNQERQNDIILHSTPTHVVGKTAFKEWKKGKLHFEQLLSSGTGEMMLGANLIWTSLELCKWLLPFGCRRRGRRSSHCCDGNWVPLQSVDRSSTFKIYRTANVAISNLNYYWQALERCITKYLCSFHARFTQLCIENIGKRWTKVQWLIFPLITLTQYIGGNTPAHGYTVCTHYIADEVVYVEHEKISPFHWRLEERGKVQDLSLFITRVASLSNPNSSILPAQCIARKIFFPTSPTQKKVRFQALAEPPIRKGKKKKSFHFPFRTLASAAGINR